MTNHSITPPPELVGQWLTEAADLQLLTPSNLSHLATQAAQWGADQELEACCEVLARELICDGKHVATDLRMIRRPKPPSLKEQPVKPTPMERALAGDAAAAKQFLHEAGFTDKHGQWLPQYQPIPETTNE
jgi:hypothetical protein